MMRRALAAFAVSLCAAATPLGAQPLEDVTMALPAVGFPFTAGYVADGLGLWEKHGLRVKSIVIAGIGSTNAVISGSADFAPDFRTVADAGGGEGTAAAGAGQHLRQAVHRNLDPQGDRRRGGLRSERAAREARTDPQGPHLRGRRHQLGGACLSAGRRADRRTRSRDHPGHRRWPATTCWRRCRPRRSTACRRCCPGRASRWSRAPRCWSRAAPERSAASRAAGLQRAGDEAGDLREAKIVVREDGPHLREAMAYIRDNPQGLFAMLKKRSRTSTTPC